MAADLYHTSMRRPVRRCLFGRPEKDDDDDDFSKRKYQMEMEAARRFQAKWNIDVTRERDDDFINGDNYNWIKIKSASDSDIPEFYSRGFSHTCKRRAVRVGKSLSFSDPREDGWGGMRASSPVQCEASSSVDLYLGLRLPHQSPHEPITPERRDDPASGSTTTTTTTEDSQSVSSSVHSGSEPLTPSPVRLGRSLTQTRLTDTFRIRKRARSVTPDRQLFTKRERL